MANGKHVSKIMIPGSLSRKASCPKASSQKSDLRSNSLDWTRAKKVWELLVANYDAPEIYFSSG